MLRQSEFAYETPLAPLAHRLTPRGDRYDEQHVVEIEAIDGDKSLC